MCWPKFHKENFPFFFQIKKTWNMDWNFVPKSLDHKTNLPFKPIKTDMDIDHIDPSRNNHHPLPLWDPSPTPWGHMPRLQAEALQSYNWCWSTLVKTRCLARWSWVNIYVMLRMGWKYRLIVVTYGLNMVLIYVLIMVDCSWWGWLWLTMAEYGWI